MRDDGADRFLTLGHGYSAAALAARLRRLAGARHHPLGRARRGDARAAASSRSTGPTRRRSTPAIARGRRAARLAAAGRRRRPGAGAARRRRWPRRAGRMGRLSLDHRGLRRPAGRLGRRGRARSRRSASAAAGGSRRRPRGAATGLPVQLFRLAGIYGPGRSVFDRLREGRAQRVVKPGQVFSRIHVDDVAAGARAPRWRGRIRGGPTTSPTTSRRRPRDVIAFAAGLLGLPVPPEVPLEAAGLSPMARSFYAESKRVVEPADQARSSGCALAYPDYRAGLRGDPRRRRLRDARQQRRQNRRDAAFPGWQSRGGIGQGLAQSREKARAGRRGRWDDGQAPARRGRHAGDGVAALCAGDHRAGAGRPAAAERQPLRRHRPHRHAERREAAGRRRSARATRPVRQHHAAQLHLPDPAAAVGHAALRDDQRLGPAERPELRPLRPQLRPAVPAPEGAAAGSRRWRSASATSSAPASIRASTSSPRKTVASDFTVTAGIGWGRLSGVGGVENPFCAISDSFCTRDDDFGEGGNVAFERFFHGEDMGFFGGVEWRTPVDGLTLKAEYLVRRLHPRAAEPGRRVRAQVAVELRRRVPGPRRASRSAATTCTATRVGFNVVISGNPKKPLDAAEPRDRAAAGQPAAARTRDGTGWVNDAEARDQLIERGRRGARRRGHHARGDRSSRPTSVEVRIINRRINQAPKAIGRTARVLAAAMPYSVETFRITPVEDGRADDDRHRRPHRPRGAGRPAERRARELGDRRDRGRAAGARRRTSGGATSIRWSTGR